MAYDPINGNGVGIGEARLFAVRAALRARTDWLNAALGQDAITSDLIGPPYGAVLEETIEIGDTEASWDPTAEGGSLRVSVCAGGMKDGLDFTTKYQYVEAGRLQTSLFTSVFIYFHPNVFRLYDTREQGYRREIAQERISDWLRNVFAIANNAQLTLTSQEFYSGSSFDTLNWVLVGAGYKNTFLRDFGATESYGFHFAIQGLVG